MTNHLSELASLRAHLDRIFIKFISYFFNCYNLILRSTKRLAVRLSSSLNHHSFGALLKLLFARYRDAFYRPLLKGDEKSFDLILITH